MPAGFVFAVASAGRQTGHLAEMPILRQYHGPLYSRSPVVREKLVRQKKKVRTGESMPAGGNCQERGRAWRHYREEGAPADAKP